MKLAFYKGRSHFFNRLVAWWTNGKYSHVEVILGRLENGDYTYLSSSFRDGGVRVKNMPLPSEKWDIVAVKGNDVRLLALSHGLARCYCYLHPTRRPLRYCDYGALLMVVHDKALG